MLDFYFRADGYYAVGMDLPDVDILELCLAGLLQAEYSSAYFGTIFHNLKMVYIAPHLQIHSTHLYREQ